MLFVRFLFCFAILTFTATSFSAMAEENFGVVDIQLIMRDAKAANSVREQVQKKQKTFQEASDKKEKELQAADQDLAKQRSLLSQEAFEEKYQGFRKKVAEAQKDYQEKRVKLDKALSQALADIQKNVLEIVKDVAKEKKLTAVLPTSQMLYAEESRNITKDVLARLDKQLPKLSVKF